MDTTPASQLWIDAYPTQGGPGEHIVNVNIEKHTGRGPRTARLTWNAELIDPVNREIVQEGHAEFADFTQEVYSSPKLGGTIAITGKSNSKNLLFVLHNPNGAELHLNYMAGGWTTENGKDIPLDPGKYSGYAFLMLIDIPANNTDADISRRVDIFGAPIDGVGVRPIEPIASCIVLTPINDTYLNVDKVTAKIPASGGSTTIKVDSNTNWELVIKEM